MSQTKNKKGKLTTEDLENEIQSLTNRGSNGGNTIFHHARKWINENYDIRLNTISHQFECRTKNEKNYSELNDNDLYVKANESNINISQNKLLAILRSNYIKRHNPVKNYFRDLPEWDGKTDHILHLLSHVTLTKGQCRVAFVKQFKKWIVRTVKCAMITDYFNKQAFILSDDGKGQNIGKSSFIRFLCPPILKPYYSENLTGNDKDDDIQLSKNLMINLDELAGLYKKELTKLKASMSKSSINVRLPYARTNSIAPRIASFIGSTNEINFLQDQTGSVRWICFVLESIDFKYSSTVNINNVWAQAYALSQSDSFVAEMTKEEIRENEIRNSRFYAMSTEEEIIVEHFEVPLDENDINVVNLSASQVMSAIKNKEPLITMRANNVLMGKYLTRLGFESTKVKGSKKYILKQL